MSNAPRTAAEYRSWWEANTEAPYGFCWCGCGEKTKIAAVTRRERGIVKGQPNRFIGGHNGRLTPCSEHETEICRRYEASDKIADIAEELGVDKSTIYAALRRNGIKAGRTLKTTEWASEARKDEICRRYAAGEGSYALAEELGVHGATVSKMLNKRGVKRRSASEAHRSHECDHSFFDELGSEAKAYWLGFLAADGVVVEHAGKSFVVRLALASEDRNHLLKHRATLQSTHAVVDYITKTGHGGISLAIASPELAGELANHGVGPRKSLTLEWPEFLTQDLLGHYLRGYFDGDGSFRARRKSSKAPVLAWEVVGNEEFCLGVQRYLIGTIGVRKTKLYVPKNSPNIRKLRYGGRRQVSRIFFLMYGGATIWLFRKRNKAAPYTY